MTSSLPNAFGFFNPYAAKAVPTADRKAGPNNFTDGVASIAAFWSDIAQSSLKAFAPQLKAPEPALEPAPSYAALLAANPFGIWAESVNVFVATLTAPPKPKPSPLDPFGVMRAFGTQPGWIGQPAADASPFAAVWPWTMAAFAPAAPFGHPFANPFGNAFGLAGMATWPATVWPTTTWPTAAWPTTLFDKVRPPSPVALLPDAPFSAYRTAGGHAVAQIIQPVSDTLTAMARLNPVVAATMPQPVAASWLATLPPWRFFNA